MHFLTIDSLYTMMEDAHLSCLKTSYTTAYTERYTKEVIMALLLVAETVHKTLLEKKQELGFKALD
jgi:hypothetical protein